ncbi:Ig-like domain repeat protein [Polaromonas sp. JS666]|uniref:Ig-like domain repeat protein n=1 Tax=Polaromonas sp. (strain JS666 / ATCC BAA-500) TaxID=296591 RepID=UPI00088D4A0F|nr:Ig-like domain repeat protein [Polaromonas sp. JS666]SDO23404.1 RHS repeat-associated core domain-containing protein [Polaromonas sp. JS666]
MSSLSPSRAFTAWLSRLVLLILLAPAMAFAGPTTTALSSSAGTAPVGQNITLTATVTGSSPTGTVTFKDGGTTVGSSALSGGVATLATNSLALGSHTLSAEYAGDTNNDPSTSGAVVVAINTGTLTWQYGYDAMGRPTTVLDPNGLATYTYYDSLGRPIQTQQPANTGSATPTTTGFAYNAADGLTQVTDPRNLATTYSPNGLGNVTAQTSPDTGASQYTYDALGNMLTKTDARGKLTQYTYDSLDRLKTVSYATGTGTIIEYDGGTTPTPATVGELTKITDASGQVTYSYDSMGRKTGKTQVTGAKTFTVGYTWGDSGSALDKLTAITYPSGTRVNYSYDAQGVVSGITVNPPNSNGVGTNTGSTLPLLNAITTNAEGKMTGWTWASAKTQAISYDANGQISAYNLGDPTTTGVRRTVVRDTAGRITGYTHVGNGSPVPALDQSFGYDNLNRLISATLGSTAIQYSYDATGNRTAKVISGTSYPNTISASSNKLTQTQDVGGTATVVHDAAGNVTSDGTNTYTYSDRGRLATMANAGGTVTYSYNALELRVGKTGPTALVPTGATYYVYDEEGKLLGEYDANGVPLYETIYMGLPVGVVKQTGTAGASNIAISLYNVSTDQLGAPRIITRQTDEAIAWRWDSAEAFGATAPDQNPSSLGIFSFNQRLPGQVLDAESGLFQNWNREYNPRIGRYMQSDPIGLEGGINTFAYVDGSPISFVDPYGKQAALAWCFGGPAGCAVGVGLTGLTWMAVQQANKDKGASKVETSSEKKECCASYTDVYDVGRENAPKHGKTQIGNRGAEPSNPEFALQNAVGASDWKLGYDGLTGELVMFRLQRTDEQKCIKYWHGYVVNQRGLTPEQWRAGRDAGFPKWTRKPGAK